MILCAAPPPKLADEIGQSAVDVNSGPQNIFLWPVRRVRQKERIIGGQAAPIEKSQKGRHYK